MACIRHKDNDLVEVVVESIFTFAINVWNCNLDNDIDFSVVDVHQCVQGQVQDSGQVPSTTSTERRSLTAHTHTEVDGVMLE